VNTAHIEIRKIPPMSPMPPVKQNDEGNHSKTVGDILSTGDMMPPADKMPPVQTTENQAQKSQIGDTGYSVSIPGLPPCMLIVTFSPYLFWILAVT
jgi:hypothetical protein